MSLLPCWHVREMHDVTLNALLESILKNGVLQASAESGRSVTLFEKSANMQVKIMDLPDTFTTIRMGGRAKLNHHPSLEKGAWNKICDYLLIARIHGEDYAVLVELKKSLSSRGSPEEQLLRSGPILEYLLAVCDIEENRTVSRPKTSHVIVFERVRLDKFSLRPNVTGQIDSISHKSIEIDRFKGEELELVDLIAR